MTKTLPLLSVPPALALLLGLTGLAFPHLRGPQEDLEALQAAAEELYARGSYELAHRRYQEAARLELGPEERRWVELRLADTAWRSAAAAQGADTSVLDRARDELAELASDELEAWERDRVWAEAHESLGDMHWGVQSQGWHVAWPHYQAALEWWASSSDLELARVRYLGIVRRVATPTWHRSEWSYGNYVGYLEPKVLRDALAVARTPEERSQMHYLLAMRYFQGGRDPRTAAQAVSQFEEVLAIGPQGEWYDDALYRYARFLEETGRGKVGPDGWTWESDYVGAVAAYRRLARELREGESRWRDDALERVRAITAASVGVSVDRFFLPGSEVRYRLSWRNLERLELALFRVDLTAELRTDKGPDDWLAAIQLEALEPLRRWSHDTKDSGEHRPGEVELSLDQELGLGAYVLEARAGGERARALVLVSDVALTAKLTGTRLLAWLTDLRTGEPLAGARLALWERYTIGEEKGRGERRERRHEAVTGADGTALLELHGRPRRTQGFLAAALGERQAFAVVGSWYVPSPDEEWRIYATTDRPTYRPGDAVGWKLVARTRRDGAYATPAGEVLRYEVRDPRGSLLAEGQQELDAFGSAWGTVETTAAAVLGEYVVQFQRVTEDGRVHVGQATLFRLEEYKAPEFEVTVRVPEDEQGRTVLYRVGDEVPAEIEATYYFGGPVAGAEVEVVVYQRPLWHVLPVEREFPWLYDDPSPRAWYGGSPGQEVLRQRLRTDAGGRARVSFETPFDAGQDFEYTVEARVVDASRREVVATHALKVTRQQFFARLEARHAIHRPGAPVEVELDVQDANGRPVPAAGRAEVTRERWVEVWLDPTGREVRGTELDALRREHVSLPPPGPGIWRRRSAGYEREVVAAAELATGESGEASWRFTPAREGTYRIVWRTTDDRGVPVQAETTVFVADEATRELGYLPGGIEILADDDTFAVGDTAAILLAAPASGRWVLFTVEAEGLLLHHEVVRLEGSVKLLGLSLSEQHVPNVFLTATMVAGGEATADVEEIVVPPKRQFLDVRITPDREALRPGEEGAWEVLVRDHAGAPAEVDVGLAVFDEALAYVQEDYAGDPRRFFYGERRADHVVTGSTFHHGTFARYRRDERGELYDERRARAGGQAEGEEALGYTREYDAGDDAYLGMRLERRQDAVSKQAAGEAAPAGPASPAPGRGGFRGPGETVPPGEGPAVRVRSDFRDTALWLPSVRTDAEGRARVSLRYPDQTTRWRATARAAGRDARFGIGTDVVRTRQPLIVRLQAPRFFQVGDELVLSGNLNNDTDQPLEAVARLDVEGLTVLGRVDGGELRANEPVTVTIPAADQVRLDWRVRVERPGEALLRLSAQGTTAADGIERRYPVHEHGIEALVARSGRFRGAELDLGLELPAARRSTELLVQVTPSLAVTMLDALPYLVGYPYGCTEQTLSRFLPTVIVTKTLADLGLSREAALERAFGGIEREHAAATHPGGPKPLEELDEMVRAGLERLVDLQHEDGGWGWWKDDEGDEHMSAYVLWGLSLAREADVEVPAGVLERAARWLALRLVEAEDRPHLQAWMLHALAVYGGETGDPRSGELVEKAYAALVRDGKDRLNAASRALLVVAAQRRGRAEDARLLLEGLYDGVRIDETPESSVVMRGAAGEARPWALRTAHWGAERGWLRWYDGGIETTAFALQALLAVDPDHELVEPAVAWLVKNRRAAQWTNTRDTSIVVLALNEFLRRGGELASEVAFALDVNGTEVARVELARDELLRAPSAIEVDPALLRDGENRIRIRRLAGEGPLYFAARATFFSLEEPIPPRGSEIFVRRQHYRLVGRPTLLRGWVHDRVPIADGDTVLSGERIEVVITAEAKTDLEHLVLEDLKPAGFEAVRVRSGEPLWARELRADEVAARFDPSRPEDEREVRQRGDARRAPDPLFEATGGGTGRTRRAHQELRDRQVAMFLDRLPQGVWELRYDLRAETPGSFHALPLQAHAMYVPEIRANGAELRVTVADAPAAALPADR